MNILRLCDIILSTIFIYLFVRSKFIVRKKTILHPLEICMNLLVHKDILLNPNKKLNQRIKIPCMYYGKCNTKKSSA